MSTIVNLLSTTATLLSSQSLTGCETPSDETCSGGASAVSAYIRDVTKGEPTLVIPKLVFETAFVQMHPLEWAVNRLVLRDRMRWAAFVAEASILMTNAVDSSVSQRDLSGLQSQDFPLLLTNADVPPRNSWEMYRRSAHLDPETGLAVMYITQSDVAESTPPIDSAKGVLDFVAKTNRDNGCADERSPYQAYTNTTFDKSKQNCYLPVVFFLDESVENFERFISAVMEHRNPPALVVDLSGNAPSLNQPHRIGQTGMWVVSYPLTTNDFYLQRITVSANHRSINNVQLIHRDLVAIPDSIRRSDAQYAADVAYMHKLGQEAAFNDPVAGYSEFMPLTSTSQAGNYRGCFGGECPLGNLFADALRWKGDTDVAFINSGGIRGPGWPAGPVRVSDLWASLPWPNTLCTGKMTGVSLFKALNYSTAVADYQSTMTDNGNRLLQVSGLRVVYNTKWQGSRLVSLDVWDRKEKQYRPMERLKLYTFASDSWMCSGMHPFPALLGADLDMEGEIPGRISSQLHQSIVAEFLANATTAEKRYDTSIQGRLVNDTKTAMLQPLNMIQTADDCTLGTYWDPELMTCEPCLDSSNVVFSDDAIEFHGDWGSQEIHFGRTVLINRELFEVGVQPRNSPSFVNITSLELSNTTIPFELYDQTPIQLQPAESLAVVFNVTAFGLQPGTASDSIAFAVLGGGGHENCVGRDLTSLPVRMTVTPYPEKNQLGNFRFVGISMMAVAICITVFFGCWIQHHRKKRMVMTMQPFFLFAICVGLVVVEMTIVPISIDDQIVSPRGCDMACMSIPWLLSMGFTITMSALFTKLWRINTLFSTQQYRRVTVRERDVLTPFAVMFVLNFVFLLSWTLVDPMVWERHHVPGETWSTYGTCLVHGTKGKALFGMVAVVNLGALLLACLQAYKARNISDEFSESKNLGMALFSWLQLLVVGLPVIALIDGSNATAKYFIYVSLIFALSILMIVFIFLPILVTFMKHKAGMRASSTRGTHSRLNARGSARGSSRTSISGLGVTETRETAVRSSSMVSSCSLVGADADYSSSNYFLTASTASLSSNSNITLLQKLEREKQQELSAIQKSLVKLRNESSGELAAISETGKGCDDSYDEECGQAATPPGVTSMDAIRRASVKAMKEFSSTRMNLAATMDSITSSEQENEDNSASAGDTVEANEKCDHDNGDDDNTNSSSKNDANHEGKQTLIDAASTHTTRTCNVSKKHTSHHQNSEDFTAADKGKDNCSNDDIYNKAALISRDAALLLEDTMADTLLMSHNDNLDHCDPTKASTPEPSLEFSARGPTKGSTPQPSQEFSATATTLDVASQEFFP